MKRYYIFEWYENKSTKYGKPPLIRTNKITLIKPTGKVEYDAKRAVELFTSNFGNLKRNSIVKIKEFDGTNKQIGEDIIPSDAEDAIIPIK